MECHQYLQTDMNGSIQHLANVSCVSYYWMHFMDYGHIGLSPLAHELAKVFVNPVLCLFRKDYEVMRELPEEQREEAAALAVELEKAKKEIRQCDAEADRRGRIADLFCKAFEKAVLLTPTEENVRIWTECTRMTREEIEDSVKDARELAEVFSTIAGILESLLPGGDGDAG